MATKAQIEMMLEKLGRVHPADFFLRIGETQTGIGAVLGLLYHSKDTVTAGKISEMLGISTARVAVLLKKMVSKGLVTKERSPIDARITIVKLTEFGAETTKKMQAEMCHHMGIVIDAIGEERLSEFISIAKDIQDVITPASFDFLGK